MAISFQNIIDRFSPHWLRRQVGGRFMGSVGAAMDAAAAKAVLISKQQNPLTCESAVLPHHAKDRRIRRYTTESESSHRVRLSKWKQIWRYAGTNYGILQQLRILLLPFGRPRMRIVSQSGDGAVATWSTLERGDGVTDYFFATSLDPNYSAVRVEPSNWVYEDPSLADLGWSRFWLIIYTDELTAPSDDLVYDSGDEWDGGKLWAGGLTAAVTSDVISLVNDWKSAGSALWGLILCNDPDAYDPSGSGDGYPSEYGWLKTGPDGSIQHPASAEFRLMRPPTVL